MSSFVDIVESKGKGINSQYRPCVGSFCEISGPNCDDDSGYIYSPTEILWSNDVFVLYGKPKCWPNLNKWDHVICRPLASNGV